MLARSHLSLARPPCAPACSPTRSLCTRSVRMCIRWPPSLSVCICVIISSHTQHQTPTGLPDVATFCLAGLQHNLSLPPPLYLRPLSLCVRECELPAAISSLCIIVVVSVSRSLLSSGRRRLARDEQQQARRADTTRELRVEFECLARGWTRVKFYLFASFALHHLGSRRTAPVEAAGRAHGRRTTTRTTTQRQRDQLARP